MKHRLKTAAAMIALALLIVAPAQAEPIPVGKTCSGTAAMGFFTAFSARNVTCDHLVQAGLLRKEPYCERPLRVEYVPTDRTVELWPVLLALGTWGELYGEPRSVTREFLHAECGEPVRAAAYCRHCEMEAPLAAVVTRPGPEYESAVTGELAMALSAPQRLAPVAHGNVAGNPVAVPYRARSGTGTRSAN